MVPGADGARISSEEEEAGIRSIDFNRRDGA